MLTSFCVPLCTLQYIDGQYSKKDMSLEHQTLMTAFLAPMRVTPIMAIPALKFIHTANQGAIQCEAKLSSLVEPLRTIFNDPPGLPSEEIK